MKKNRVLLVSCGVIILSMFIIIGMTYALFTDQVLVKNHLRAGNLDITLTRTNLEYSVLNSEGKVEVITNEEKYDFTESTNENVFGLDSSDTVIVPGMYFDAEMEIANKGNVAFEYNVSIVMTGETNALAEQLKVTITHPDGSVTTKMLSELDSELSIVTGMMNASEEVQSFRVRVEFIDVEINNDAQNQTAEFDLIVTAIQVTTRA